MAKKQAPTPSNEDTLGSIAESLGTMLGNAEKQWRAWQGPRDAVVQAVTDVRDRAVALLSEMDVARMGVDQGKKKDKKARKDEKKKAEKAARADQKSGKKTGKAGKRKKGKKNKQTDGGDVGNG